jgi:4-hydroxysphinganine ceramide fatty acyl 2-hydroxylase
MPGRILPTFTLAEVQSHNTKKSCFVTLGENVYDVTDFIDAHPGGGDLVLEYAGKDIKDILEDEASHTHSEAAYEVLEDSHVGFLASTNGKASSAAANGVANGANGTTYVHPRTGMSCEEDLSKDTDISSDYKTHKFRSSTWAVRCSRKSGWAAFPRSFTWTKSTGRAITRAGSRLLSLAISSSPSPRRRGG